MSKDLGVSWMVSSFNQLIKQATKTILLASKYKAPVQDMMVLDFGVSGNGLFYEAVLSCLGLKFDGESCFILTRSLTGP